MLREGEMLYLVFRHSKVISRSTVSPSAAEAPSDPKDRTDLRTSTPSFRITQSNRPGSV